VAYRSAPQTQSPPQTEWHINAASGNDKNDGKTPATAIRTVLGGYYARMSLEPLIDFTEDWYIHGDLDPSDTLLLAGSFSGNGFRNVHGVPVVLRTSTLTGVTAYDQTTGQWDEIQDGAFDFTPYVGNTLVVIDTGSPNGPSYCWIAKAIAPGRARVSYLAQRDPASLYYEDIGPAAVGNSYQLWQLPFATNYLQAFAAYSNNDGPQTFVEFMHLPKYTVLSEGPILHSECLYEGLNFTAPVGYVNNPCIHPTEEDSSFGVSGGTAETTLGLLLDATAVVSSGTWFMEGMIWQNSRIQTDEFNGFGHASTIEIHHASTGLGIFDSENPLVIDAGAGLLVEGAIWGSGNTGTTLALDRGGAAYIATPASVRLLAQTPAGGNDLTIGGYTSIPAIDPATFVASAPRVLSFASYLANYASGGFQGAAFDPRFPSTGIKGGV
jgi:hypothetical protein